MGISGKKYRVEFDACWPGAESRKTSFSGSSSRGIFIEALYCRWGFSASLLCRCPQLHDLVAGKVERHVQNYWYARTPSLVGNLRVISPLWCTTIEFCFSLLGKNCKSICPLKSSTNGAAKFISDPTDGFLWGRWRTCAIRYQTPSIPHSSWWNFLTLAPSDGGTDAWMSLFSICCRLSSLFFWPIGEYWICKAEDYYLLELWDRNSM